MVGKEWDSRKAKQNLLNKLRIDVDMENLGESDVVAEEPEKNGVLITEDLAEEIIDDAIEVDPKSEKNAEESEEKKKPGVGRKILRVFVYFLTIAICAGTIGAAGYYFYTRESFVERSYVGPIPSYGSGFVDGIVVDVPAQKCELEGGEVSGIELTASSYFIFFADDFEILASKNKDEPVAFASIVKLLGVIVALDEYELDTQLGLLEAVDVEGSGLELEVGEKVSVGNLVAASLVGSKNDAMMVLAQNYPGGVEGFVVQMQMKAEELGMQDTFVQNPTGLDVDGQVSTPRDLAVLSVAAMNNEVMVGYVGLQSVQVNTSLGRTEVVESTNDLVGLEDSVIGLKTGYTEDAGLCLVSYIDWDKDFVVVLLGSEDRFGESQMLIEWVKGSCGI